MSSLHFFKMHREHFRKPTYFIYIYNIYILYMYMLFPSDYELFAFYKWLLLTNVRSHISFNFQRFDYFIMGVF